MCDSDWDELIEEQPKEYPRRYQDYSWYDWGGDFGLTDPPEPPDIADDAHKEEE